MYTHFRFCIETMTLIVCMVCALTITHEKKTEELLLKQEELQNMTLQESYLNGQIHSSLSS